MHDNKPDFSSGQPSRAATCGNNCYTTIATTFKPVPKGKAFTRAGFHPTPAVAMARRPHVSSISSLVHPHDTSQDSDDPEAQSGVLPDNATLLPATRRPVASRGIVDTRICRSLSSCNVNATPLQEHGHLDSDPRGMQGKGSSGALF